ncbi:MAG: family 78 glycoside hydrolase catalytic domain, partial [Marinilabiliales bacterium]|nr:family 78 glycoside hydrolase catalytic domain [Marinilabiliales bacterium]
MPPRFSWQVSSSRRNARQSAYQLEVASAEAAFQGKEAFLWDSGKMLSAESQHVVYQGPSLPVNVWIFYRVTVWDDAGKSCKSGIQRFRLTVPGKGHWDAKWIGSKTGLDTLPAKGFFSGAKEEGNLGDRIHHDGRSLLLRRSFEIRKKLKSAWVAATGLGLYELFINGRRVGDQVLSPAKSPYHMQILYDNYDVTDWLKRGENAVAFHVGNGWYNPYKKWWQEYRMQWFGSKKAILQLQLTFEDGSCESIVTDESWKTLPGPALFNCIYDGELFDAREEPEGWKMPGFDDHLWSRAVTKKAPLGRLTPTDMPPIRVVETKRPVGITYPRKGVVLYNFGQNFAGWARFTFRGKAGTKVRIRYSEELDKSGNLDVTCNEGAGATAEYILKGGGKETYEPQFTYFGFQYAEVTAEPELPELDDALGCVIQSDNRVTGSFDCDNELVNKIHRATVWSQKSNMLGYPMDCPQRDERLGWFGDAQVTAEEALFNFDMEHFYRNWFAGIRENQNQADYDIPIISPRPYMKDEGVEWSSSYLTMVWDHYRYYGDKALIEANYEAMCKYLEFLDHHGTGFIQPKGWIGDWGSKAKGWKEGDPESVPTAYYHLDALLLSRMADVIGKPKDAENFRRKAIQIADAYNRQFFHPENDSYLDGSQMANAFPLYLGLVPEGKASKVLEHLIQQIEVADSGHLTTGVLGTKYMPEMLANVGRAEVAWHLITRKGYPSWALMMEKYNTMCEFWTLKQSHNHVMMGSIDSWFYENLAGIHLVDEHPAYEQMIL